ncbi:MAG: hypothetical protein AVDCRST_MAG56-7522 [uncultured Cytophagales bacterium]|uniref:Uncharacterized protein n=1 Tax=uncultured Cytophagales bacterium TaxID=158755 RepID=A0A6J4LJ85_9SPHI|nr:MAG: hypothetical protein AVDCRST_MAG56-7522 [uncultured Cytophagales bacterium]
MFLFAYIYGKIKPGGTIYAPQSLNKWVCGGYFCGTFHNNPFIFAVILNISYNPAAAKVLRK